MRIIGSLTASLKSPIVSRFGVLAVVLLSGCQLVFGDYDTDPNFDPQGKGGAAASGGASSTCTTGTYDCNGDTLRRCDAEAWVDVKQCESGRCNADWRQCDVCGAGEARCNTAVPPSVEQCSSSRTEWIEYQKCAADQVCDPVHLVCTVCPDGDRCEDSGTLSMCVNNGTRWVSKLCSNLDQQCHSVDGPDYCTECVGTGTDCSTEQVIRTCVDGRYVTVTPCPKGCQNIGGVWSCIP